MKLNKNARVHASKHPTLQFRNTQNSSTSIKPKGLWYGFGSSWIDWSRHEMPEWDVYNQHLFALEVDTSHVCIIDNVDTLDVFHELYSTLDRDLEASMIDWAAVQRDYDGIEINPYNRSLPFELWQKYSWYSSWDVSSGCLWNKHALLSVKKIT